LYLPTEKDRGGKKMEKQMIRPATGTATLTVGRHVATAVDTQVRAATRLLFVDNLRVLLTILVILHHLMITYAGNGSWYYQEGRQDVLSGALGGWFLAVNQAYFMGLFLLISAYFVPGSYDRKGARHFVQDRLIRLGIPLALYSWLIRPLLAYLNPVRHPDGRPPLVSFLTGTYFQQEALFGGGPLWFVETLLIFSAVYVAWRLLTRRRPAAPGATDTAFAARHGMQDVRIFQNAMSPVRVARIGYRALHRGRPVVVAGLGNRLQVLGLQLMAPFLPLTPPTMLMAMGRLFMGRVRTGRAQAQNQLS
jgi:hypothetical protein